MVLFVICWIGSGLVVIYFFRFVVGSRTSRYRQKGPPIPVVVVVVIWPIVVLFGICMLAASIYTKWRRWVLRRNPLNWLDDRVGRLFKRKIHEDKFGILYEMPSPWGKILKVKVKDTTGTYWLPVPATMTRAKQAVAWTYQKSEDGFNPIRRA